MSVVQEANINIKHYQNEMLEQQQYILPGVEVKLKWYHSVNYHIVGKQVKT